MTKEMKFKIGGSDNSDLDEVLSYRDSILHGQYIKYFDNGNIAKTGEYINGIKLNTKWTDFYETGQIHREYIYQNKYEAMRIINMWDELGLQTVRDGKGKHVSYDYCANGRKEFKIVTKYLAGEIIGIDSVKVSACR